MTILIVDDQMGVRIKLESLCKEIDGGRAQILSCSTATEALDILSSTPVQVVLLDKQLGPNQKDPKQNGIEAIPSMLEIDPQLQILVVTGSNDLNDAVQAMKYGAFGYVLKGGQDKDDAIVAQTKNALRVARLSKENARRERASFEEDDLHYEFVLRVSG